MQRDLADGPEAAVTRILEGNARRGGVPDDFARLADVLKNAAVGANSPGRLKAWWFYRMLFAPDALTEKLALMWHNHFATSNLKVDDLSAMLRQNETFRRYGRGPFRELLRAVLQDPAMLTWLDADSNRKARPNENLARELMELFTLGVGNYTEGDVKEGARALTGWTIRGNAFFNDAERHDGGEKTILGRTGRWRGDDFLDILLENPATAHRVAWRICDLLMGEGMVDETSLDELAIGLREHNLDISWALEQVLRSETFFSNGNIASRVSSPVEFSIGAIRALECFDPPPSTFQLAQWIARMGQDLFYPPNVGGWSGGRDWLSGRYALARARFAAELVEGELSAHGEPVDVAKLVERNTGITTVDSAAAVEFFAQLLLGHPIDDLSRARIISSTEKMQAAFDDRIRWAATVLLASPEAQLN